MSTPPAVDRGVRALRRLLRERTVDLRGLNVAGFRGWLEQHLARWHSDPVFAQRARIRDLRRAYPRVRALEEERRRTTGEDAAAPQYPRLAALGKELEGVEKAIAGLTAALARAPAEQRPALEAKLAAFHERWQALRDEQAGLVRSSPARQALLRVEAELQAARAEAGLDREEVRLEELLRQQGRRSGRSGASFEGLALTLTQDVLVPGLVRGAAEAGRLRVLTGVTLGAARVEFDQLVVRLPRDGGRPAEVLAVVEVKRNVNDLAHGFRLRQENLAWLTGDAGNYDPAAYRTGIFTSGHFDRPAVHRHGGDALVFDRTSFRRFRREGGGGPFLRRLYFITRAGGLWGISTAALARIAFRVATDEGWEPGDVAYLGRLLNWCRLLAEPVEAPDVLRTYAAAPRRARQVLIVCPGAAGA